MHSRRLSEIYKCIRGRHLHSLTPARVTNSCFCLGSPVLSGNTRCCEGDYPQKYNYTQFSPSLSCFYPRHTAVHSRVIILIPRGGHEIRSFGAQDLHVPIRMGYHKWKNAKATNLTNMMRAGQYLWVRDAGKRRRRHTHRALDQISVGEIYLHRAREGRTFCIEFVVECSNSLLLLVVVILSRNLNFQI